MPKTEANTRPDNRKVKQARSQVKQAMALFKRRMNNLNKTDLFPHEKEKRRTALRKEYMKTIKPFQPILQKNDEKVLEREVQQTMSDKGYSSGRSTNSDNKTIKAKADKAEREINKSAADTPGKGSDEPITKRNKNKGGLIKTGAKDYRKGGMFY